MTNSRLVKPLAKVCISSRTLRVPVSSNELAILDEVSVFYFYLKCLRMTKSSCSQISSDLGKNSLYSGK